MSSLVVAGGPAGYPAGIAPTQTVTVVKPAVYGPGAWTFRAPVSGRYAFRLWGPGGAGTANTGSGHSDTTGGPSGAYAKKTAYLGAGQQVSISVSAHAVSGAMDSTAAPTVVKLPFGTVSAGGGGAPGTNASGTPIASTIVGTASGGDVNASGTIGTGSSDGSSGSGGTSVGDEVCPGGAGGLCSKTAPGGGCWPGGGGGGGSSSGPGADGGCIVTFEGI